MSAENSILTVTKPFDGEVLAELQRHDAKAVDQMLKAAKNRHRQGALPAYERLAILERLVVLMRKEHEALAAMVAKEGGKPLMDARVEAERAIDGVRIALAEMQNLRGSEIPMDLTAAGFGRLAFTTIEPIGVVVAVSAFNHPLNLIVHQVVPAIAVGCPVIVKPAEATPLSCLRFVELAHKAGLPEGWVQVALTSAPNSEKLVTDPRVGFFSFIGSARVGWMLRQKLPPGTRLALEHGGSAPLVFDNYADLDGFVKGVVQAGFYHAGQVCVSVQRIFVPAKRAREIAAKIAAAADALVVGDAIFENTDVGPLITNHEVVRVGAWIDEAIAEGAKLITGGSKINDSCYRPTVLLNPDPKSKVSTLEIFGPVVCVYGYQKINDAIEMANGLDVAFQASVFSDNIQSAIRTAKALDASAVMINDYTTFRTDWMPFAGRKHSGYGIGGIGYTMRDMVEEKMLVIKY